MKRGFVEPLEKVTRSNGYYRRVLYTSENMQLVVMTLEPEVEIGLETHPDTDQFFRIESGTGVAIINGISYIIQNGTGIVVPAGVEHNIINTNQAVSLKLYTIYSPPHHQDKLVQRTKKSSLNADEVFTGVTTE